MNKNVIYPSSAWQRIVQGVSWPVNKLEKVLVEFSKVAEQKLFAWVQGTPQLRYIYWPGITLYIDFKKRYMLVNIDKYTIAL